MVNEPEFQRKKSTIIYVVLGILLIASLIFGIYQFKEKNKVKNELNNAYTRAFIELGDYVDDIETNLRKCALASSPSQIATISGDIHTLSESAEARLGELPISNINLDKTARFLAQVGDYTYLISQNAISGMKMSEEEFSTLGQLIEYAEKLNGALSKTEQEIADGNITIAEKNGMAVVCAASNDVFSDFEKIEKSFENYPSLIYDGPFSEHIENRKSEMLDSAKDINLDEAKKLATRFLKASEDEVTYGGDVQNSNIASYVFYYENASVNISKKGGYIVSYLKNREVQHENINFSKAIEKGNEFLSENGFYSMRESYYDKDFGIATVNFAYYREGVKCYSDLIKVKVALDNGEILGIETAGYLMNHTNRSFENPKLSIDEAKENLSPHLEITSGEMALIPKDSLEEVLCYEFHGSYIGRNFIIYVNCENGREEKILMLIESENGILTV